ncbi:MAG: DUF2012 domain-containing protein [Anaeromyxobacteraceae bacterium]|nr:DUF2012 domain-containing protein [Anaeromyxobacteraceae bacterium]
MNTHREYPLAPTTLARSLAPVLLLLAAACGSKGSGPCDVAAQAGCGAGLVCEPVVGGSPACFDPVYVSGRVYDLATGAGLADARVVALDADGAPASRVGFSAPVTQPVPGAYALAVPTTRNADGSPAGASFTLRADRPGYETFPSGLREALPVSSSGARHAGGRWTISASQTDLGLAALASSPGGRIDGTVALPAAGAGVLLVAEETTTHAGLTAVSGRDGDFSFLNVPDGTYEVRAFIQGMNFTPVTVTVSGGQASPASAALAPSAVATARVGGSVNFVSSRAWDATSVLLVVASTFDPDRVRGAAPPGLKASGISGTWSIDGVPDGHYRVLAGFETDYLVRDPSDIGGTAVLEFQVRGGVPKLMDGTSVTALASFKITGAVRLTSPLRGLDGGCIATVAALLPADPAGLLAGACTTASETPLFTWEGFSSQDFYEVTVIDDLGAVAWRARVLKAAPATTYGAAAGVNNVQATLSAPVALVAGRTYQVKIAAKNNPKTPGGVEETLSVSEDLLGVFTYQPPPPPP